MLRETGCAGVMVGRAALGNPWIFREMAAYLLRGERVAPPTPWERVDMTWQHATLLAGGMAGPTEEPQVPIPPCARGQLSHYLHGLPGAAMARQQMGQIRLLGDVRRILDGVEEQIAWQQAPG